MLKDIDDKILEIGHIVAVRYVWNSVVGEIQLRGLCATGSLRHAFFSPHSLKETSTYQVLSHKDKNHKDYNEDASKWYNTEDKELPFKLRIYDNMPNNV